MKKRTLIVLFSITTIGALILSGCTNQTPNNTNNQQTINEEFTTDATGGNYDLAGGLIHVDIPQNAVQQQINITVDSIPDPPYDTDVVLSNCYSFGPEGTMFNDNINLTLQYDTSIIPSNISTDIMHLFSLAESDTTWSKIQNCVVDSSRHTVTGPILHFSMIGVGYTNQDYLYQQSTHNQNNSSAIITFEVPVQLVEWEDIFTWPSGEEDKTVYNCGAVCAWDPQPYVRYYAVTIHFNGNPSHSQPIVGSCDYRRWNTSSCRFLPYPDPDNKVVFLGPLDQIPGIDIQDHYGSYSLSLYIPKAGIDPSKHGIGRFSMYTDFYSDENLTRGEMDAIEDEMYAFTQSYVAGWTVTVQPFT